MNVSKFKVSFAYSENPVVIMPERETSLPIIGNLLHKKVIEIFDTVTVSCCLIRCLRIYFTCLDSLFKYLFMQP